MKSDKSFGDIFSDWLDDNSELILWEHNHKEEDFSRVEIEKIKDYIYDKIANIVADEFYGAAATAIHNVLEERKEN